MSAELAWWVGAPFLGTTMLAGAILSPRLRKDRLRTNDAAPVAGALPVMERRRARATAESTSDAAEVETRTDQEVHVPPTRAVRLGVRFGDVRQLIRRPRRESTAPSVVEQVHAEVFPLQEVEGTGEPVPLASRVESIEVDAPALAPIDAAAAENDDAGDATGAAPVDLTSSIVHDDADAAEREARIAENGIMDLAQIPGATPAPRTDVDEWQRATAAREARLAADLERERQTLDAAEREVRERETEAAAVAHQRELERIAVAEEARARAEARARKWYARLDLDIDVPTLRERMLLATSLAAVRAPWAGKLLRTAFLEEEEPRVRARILGALAGGDHLADPAPFIAGFEHDGIERAAVVEVLLPRQSEASWIAELLAPLAAA